MKTLKKILYVILALILVWLIAAAFISGDCKYEKSILINAPTEKVWQNTNSLKAMDQWNPWDEKDPNIKKQWSGKTGQVGEKQCWQSEMSEVGNGCVTLIKIDSANKRIDAEMKFLTPYESEAQEYVIISPEGNGSKATWGFTSVIPYPFTVMKLFMNLENMVGPDYQKGLNKLKKLSEQ